MRRAILALISLYPRAWRGRYKSEFDALLEQVKPTWRTLFDVLGGALKMQVKMWSPWKIVPLFAIAGVIAAAAYSLTMPNRYQSTAVIKMDDPSKQLGTVLSNTFLTQLINEENLYQSERLRIPIQDVIQNMKENIAIAPARSPGILAISFTSKDGRDARRVTERLAYRFNDSKTWALLDAPGPPVLSKPRRSRIIAMGLLAGTIAGALFALFNGLRVWKLAAGLGAAGAVLFGATSYLLTDRYSSVVMVQFDGSAAALSQAIDATTSPANLERFAVLFKMYPDDPQAARKLRENLHIELLPGTHGVFLRFNYTNRYIAQTVAARIAYHLMDTPGVEMIDPATLPFNPYFPNHVNVTFAGLALGLLAATILGIRERIHA